MTSFVIALAAEARPLIERYRLEPVDGPFRVYRGGGRRLVVSGVGREAASAATARLRESAPESAPESLNDVWINIGIAGHRHRSPGEIVRAHRVTDGTTKESFYPTLLNPSPLESSGVTTVDAPETEFATDDVYDMEAAAFYASAVRFSTSELVLCLKIVSDNRDTGTRGLSAARVSAWIESQLDIVDELVAHLEALRSELARASETGLDPFLDRWRFTTSEQRQLRRLSTRYAAMRAPFDAGDFGGARTASEVLNALAARLRTLALERRAF